MPNFPQPVRQTIVHKIDVYLTDVIENIYKAAHTTIKENKNNYLNNASNSLDLLKFFLFIIWETKILDNNKFALLSENIHWIGKMLGNWIKSLDKNNKG